MLDHSIKKILEVPQKAWTPVNEMLWSNDTSNGFANFDFSSYINHFRPRKAERQKFHRYYMLRVILRESFIKISQ